MKPLSVVPEPSKLTDTPGPTVLLEPASAVGAVVSSVVMVEAFVPVTLYATPLESETSELVTERSVDPEVSASKVRVTTVGAPLAMVSPE